MTVNAGGAGEAVAVAYGDEAEQQLRIEHRVAIHFPTVGYFII